jgi:peptidoglycan/LPS O-acetylase OafA/YrhL
VWLKPPLDISYGIYLFAFPVQQLIASYGLSWSRLSEQNLRVDKWSICRG